MPYRRAYRASRKFYGAHARYARRWGRAGQSVARAAFSASSTANRLARVLNVEYKHYDTQIASAISSTPTVTDLTAIIQGDDVEQRNGRSIKAMSLFLQGLYTGHTSATRTTIRTVVVLDTRPDMGTPTYADVYEANSVTSLREINELQGRFRVLFDSTRNMTIASSSIVTWKKYIPLRGLHIKYDGTAAANVSQNGLYLMQISTEPTNTPSQSTEVRLRYVDN